MPDTMSQPEPWERQPGEPNRWYARFERYRLAGPSRSLLGTVSAEKAEQGQKIPNGIPGAWSRAAGQWRWRERAEAWDEQERRRARQARAQEVEEMNHRHIQESQALQNKALQRLKTLNLDLRGKHPIFHFAFQGNRAADRDAVFCQLDLHGKRRGNLLKFFF